MTAFIRNGAIAIMVLIAAWLFAGCYTQLGTVDDDRDYSYSAEEYAPEVVDSTAEEGETYDDEEYSRARSRFYFDSYYPVGMSFGWGYGHFYSPWDWYYGPYYGYPYSHYYYPVWGYYPPYFYYPPNEPGYWYPHGSSVYSYNKTRTIGNTRMSGVTRGTYTGSQVGVTRSLGRTTPAVQTGRSTYVPKGDATRSTTRSTTPRATTGRRSTGTEKSATPAPGTSVKRGKREEGRRDSGSRYVPSSPPPRREGRNEGSRSSGSSGRSYSPPSSSGPSHSAPAPSRDSGGGGRSSSGGGSNNRPSGGGRR